MNYYRANLIEYFKADVIVNNYYFWVIVVDVV